MNPLVTAGVLHAIFTDFSKATHTVQPSAVPVFSHAQVVGLGMAQSLSVNGARSRVSSSTLQHRLGPPLWAWRWRRLGGLAGASGACVWVRASQTQPESHTIPALAEPFLHLIITSSE